MSGQLVVESMEDVVLREFFGGDATKRLQATLIAAYVRRELQCLEVGAGRGAGLGVVISGGGVMVV